MLLFTKVWKTPAAPQDRLVFLHGMGGTGTLWRPAAAAFEDAFEIWAPDQRGHGQSRVPGGLDAYLPTGFSPRSYGRDLLETLDGQPAVNGRTWLIGHSMGVRTACAAAALAAPGRFAGLVLIDLGLSGPAGGGLGDDLHRFLSELPEEFPDRAAARETLFRLAPDPSLAQYLLAVSAALPSGRWGFPFDREVLLATIDAARGVDLEPWLRELGAGGLRALFLRGAESRVWTSAEFEASRARFRDLPGFEFAEIAGAGHGLPFEKRTEFVTAIRTFIG